MYKTVFMLLRRETKKMQKKLDFHIPAILKHWFISSLL